MSKDNVKKMFGKIEKEAEFQKKYAELILACRREADKILADKLVELGQASGFVFSIDDLTAARTELADHLNATRELSDNDLAKVAGGGASKIAMIFTSIIGIGLGCAVTSIIGSSTRYGCSAILTTDGKCHNE